VSKTQTLLLPENCHPIVIVACHSSRKIAADYFDQRVTRRSAESTDGSHQMRRRRWRFETTREERVARQSMARPEDALDYCVRKTRSVDQLGGDSF
jgi:hypothetical protein